MSLLLLFAAFVCGIIATIMGFGWFGSDGSDFSGWLAASLTLFYASHLVGPAVDFSKSRRE